MSQQSVFEKKYVENDKMNDVEGVLEHFNLPPQFISFIRKHVRIIQISIAVIVVLVIAVVMFKTYQEKKVRDSSNALSLAIEESGENKINALNSVVSDYSGTDAALWATVELGHQYMKDQKFSKAQLEYSKVANDTAVEHPAHPLALFGQGQAYEALGNYDDAKIIYQGLKDIEGYRDIAFLGIARSYEAKEEFEAAIAIYNEYLLTREGASPQVKKYIEGKIARLQRQK